MNSAEVEFYQEILEKEQFSKGFCIALESQDYEMIPVFFNRVMEWNLPLQTASRIGDMFFIEICFERVAYPYTKGGMYAAAEGGHMEIWTKA